MAEKDAGELAPGELLFVTRGVSAAETAAVNATISALLREESDARRAVENSAPDAWQRSQRGLRAPHHPGPGQWRGFHG